MSSCVQEYHKGASHDNLLEDGVIFIRETYFSRVSFLEKSTRIAFIRKVYGILMVQLLITLGFITAFALTDELRFWIIKHNWIIAIAFVVALIIILMLSLCQSLSRKTPHNYYLLVVFTIAESLVIATITSYYDSKTIILAVGITATICLALTAFAFQTKYDFTAMGMVFLALFITALLFGIFLGFLPRSTYPTLHIVYSSVMALLFCFHLIYDTQLMIGGKHKYKISPEEYIFAALNLYLDIIYIFIHMLNILRTNN